MKIMMTLNRWNKCSNKLPKEDEWVLIAVNGCDEQFMDVARYNKHDNDWDSAGGTHRDGEDVTYWRRLPKFPKN